MVTDHDSNFVATSLAEGNDLKTTRIGHRPMKMTVQTLKSLASKKGLSVMVTPSDVLAATFHLKQDWDDQNKSWMRTSRMKSLRIREPIISAKLLHTLTFRFKHNNNAQN